MKKRYLIVFLTSFFAASPYFTSFKVSAASASNWQAGNIIADAVFANKDAMSPADIQNFLNQQVGSNQKNSTPGVCDTYGSQTSELGGGTRAQYGASHGNPAPFTCLKDYYEVPKTQPGAGIPVSNYGGQPIPSGAISAAQIIWNAAHQYNISPKVLLAILQKESAGPLITDAWPTQSQYLYPMGAHCPDSTGCDPNYAGFSIQISESAALFRYYLDNMNQPWWPYKKQGNNSVLYNPQTSCGSSVVNIQSKATAALYTYTPYQPNQAALNNLYGSGDSCSAYGNRNFWRIFSDWFGSTQTNIPYAWSLVSENFYSDPQMTQPLTGTPTTAPGGKIYVRLKALNIGYQTWDSSVVHLGVSSPIDRTSIFQDSSWLNPQRPAGLSSSVASGDIGTFNFILHAPQTTGDYVEHFNLVADGTQWLNDLGLTAPVNVVTPISPTAPIGTKSQLSPGDSLSPGQYLLSPDTHSVLVLQGDGNLVLYDNFRAVWNSGTTGKGGNRLTMQPDGNLVLYSGNNVALWNSQTWNHQGASLSLQTDGNLVVYDSNNSPLWYTATVVNPTNLGYTNAILSVGDMYPGQSLQTANRKYEFILQLDGNLVLYSNGKPLWSSVTHGQSVSRLSMQGDGNLVLYTANNVATWYSHTYGNGPSSLVMQDDGNAVVYNVPGFATWNTQTYGKE